MTLLKRVLSALRAGAYKVMFARQEECGANATDDFFEAAKTG